MVEAIVNAYDANGKVVAFTLGMGRNRNAAIVAANTGMTARMLANPKLHEQVRRYTFEVL